MKKCCVCELPICQTRCVYAGPPGHWERYGTANAHDPTANAHDPTAIAHDPTANAHDPIRSFSHWLRKMLIRIYPKMLYGQYCMESLF